jgi:outer membrane protein OmpA-like peptidoglycan-associated protein
MRGFAAAITCVVFLATGLRAQVASIGIRGGYLSVSNATAIPVLFGAGDCGSFSNGISSGMYASLSGDYELFGELLEVGGGVLYAKRPARLSTQTQAGFEVLDPVDNIYKPLVQEHVFESTLGYVSIEASLRSRPISWLPVYLRATFDAGNPVVSSDFAQTEQIVSPESILYPENVKRRTVGSGEFAGLGTSMGVTGAIGAAFKIGSNLEIGPEIFYRHGLGSLSSAASWEQTIIGGGVQLRYRLIDAPKPPAEEPPPPPPAPAPEPAPIVESVPEFVPAVIASVTTVPLEIRETVVTQTFPLLPYVFFDSASTALRASYRQSTSAENFDERTLPRETLSIYYRILDVLGARLTANPVATLDLTGTSDGAEGSTPEQRTQIARERAQSIATYLLSRWNISSDRLRVRVSERPAIASNELYSEGAEENRRVELSSSDVRLLDPIVHTRFNEYVPVQSQHTFTTDVTNPERADGWKLDVLHKGLMLAQRSGPLMPPSKIVFDLTQEMTDKLGPIMGTSDTLTANLVVRQPRYGDARGATAFPVIKTVSNFEVSRLSLIVFDYDRADISAQNQEMMRRVVSASTGSGSRASIVGSTDRLGEFDHNMQLSIDRAKSVENFVRSIAPSLNIEDVQGVGPNPSLFDNSLPEGRFYCRTVTLQITTPLRDR